MLHNKTPRKKKVLNQEDACVFNLFINFYFCSPCTRIMDAITPLKFQTFHYKTSQHTVKPVLSDHIKQNIFLAFQTGGCLLLHESSAESSCRSFLHFFHSVISSHLSIVISMSPEWMVA